jgi:DNA polymerase/3'-5' exonuclease PolX
MLRVHEQFIDGVKVDQWFSDDMGEEFEEHQLEEEEKAELGKRLKWIQRADLKMPKP